LALLLGASLALPQDSTETAGALLSADIRIVLYDSYASVAATYDIDRSGARLVFDAVRLPHQVVLLGGAFGPDFTFASEQLIAARRLTAPPAQPGNVEIRIRYDIEGEFGRIPVYVPNASLEDVHSAVAITVIGAEETADLAGSDPALRRLPDGTLVAAANQLPGSVTLPFLLPDPAGWPAGFWIALFLAAAAAAALAALAARTRLRS
jgi:hypothetical protein